MKPIIIAIAGGSGSGKTTVVKEILDRFAQTTDISVISHDDYYKKSNLSDEERKHINYDHPDSLDNELFATHLEQLLSGKTIDKPVYDFVIHNRSDKTETVKCSRIIIIEGILVLENKQIRDLADIKIYVKCDEDLRFIRRMKRDIYERGRSIENIIEQYLATVKPMFNQYIRPTSRYADIIIPNDEKHDVALEFLVSRIKDILNS